MDIFFGHSCRWTFHVTYQAKPNIWFTAITKAQIKQFMRRSGFNIFHFNIFLKKNSTIMKNSETIRHIMNDNSYCLVGQICKTMLAAIVDIS